MLEESGQDAVFGGGAGWNRAEMSNHGIDPRKRMKVSRIPLPSSAATGPPSWIEYWHSVTPGSPTTAATGNFRPASTNNARAGPGSVGERDQPVHRGMADDDARRRFTEV